MNKLTEQFEEILNLFAMGCYSEFKNGITQMEAEEKLIQAVREYNKKVVGGNEGLRRFRENDENFEYKAIENSYRRKRNELRQRIRQRQEELI